MKIIIFLVIFVQSEAGPMLGLLGTFPTLDACETVLKKIKESDEAKGAELGCLQIVKADGEGKEWKEARK